ncbi:TetR/AcrR family transcriptional regulator [Sphingobium sp. H39-3-25]|uniref:TetR/AcrR family transcriptional regulator n=1 Tax=Sphingobium arseniciresistens TaxID=3030834 RepID=UPI0023B94A31|nr:TetR/AcrR family transcriptional regulator [Sphingobium arseniciresistens]
MTRPGKDGTADAARSPGRRGRPTAERVGEIDTAIRLAARQCFIDTGFDATRMEDIAATAQVSKGTLYARYASKQSLFRAVVTDLLENLSARASRQGHLIPEAFEPRMRHHARVLITVYSWSDYTQVTRLIHEASRSFPEILHVWEEMGTRHYIDFLARDMASASKLPPGIGVDWTLLAHIFLHSIAGWYNHQIMAGTVCERETEAHCNKVIGAIMAIIDASRPQLS